MGNDNRTGDFSEPMMCPRYTGIPTFMRTPFTEALDDVDIGLIGVPFDGGVTNRTGARHGPREIRNQSSLMRRVNQATRVAPFDLCRVWVVSQFDFRARVLSRPRERTLRMDVCPLRLSPSSRRVTKIGTPE